MDFHSLFPLKEENRWIYRTDRGSLSVQVTEKQVVGTKSFFILETRVDEELLQREKYLVDVDAFWLLSRTFGDHVFMYDPPNPILIAPADVGKAWDWKGNCGGQNVEFHFMYMEKNTIRVPSGSFPSVKVEIKEFGMGGKSNTTRWYSAGVGMIQESMISDQMQYEAELEAYKIN